MPETLFFLHFYGLFSICRRRFPAHSDRVFSLSVPKYTYNRHNAAYNHAFIKRGGKKGTSAKKSPYKKNTARSDNATKRRNDGTAVRRCGGVAERQGDLRHEKSGCDLRSRFGFKSKLI